MGAVLSVIFLFYMGHEFLYITLLVNLDGSIIPKETRNTAVACYGCFDFIGAFIGQIFVTYVFTKRGMNALAPYMLVIEGISSTSLILMNVSLHIKRSKQTEEKIAQIMLNEDNIDNDKTN